MYYSDNAGQSRVDAGMNLNDGITFEREAFQELKMLGIVAASIEEMDYSYFIQDYQRIFPCAIRTFSIASKTQSKGSLSQEFDLPSNGTYLYGMTPQIFIDGIVAAKTQNATHGDGNTAEGYIGTGSPTGDEISRVKLISGATTHVADWVSLSNQTETFSTFYGKYGARPNRISIWDSTNGQWDDGSGNDVLAGNAAPTINDVTDVKTNTGVSASTWYYVYAISVTPDLSQTLTNPRAFNDLVMWLVPATPYQSVVAEGHDEEPYYYAPGYSIGNELVIESHNHDQLFKTSAEYSYYLNQMFRSWDQHLEDQRLANVYVDERFQLHADPQDEDSYLFPRQIAQRKSRRSDAVYTPFRHPFMKAETSIPTSLVFSQNLKFFVNMLNPRKAIVTPKPSQYDLSSVFVRPNKNNDKGEQFTNEELRRGANGAPAVSVLKTNHSIEDSAPEVRLEMVLVDSYYAEMQILESAHVPIVTRQPCVYHKTISADSMDVSVQSGNLPRLTTSQSPQKVVTHSFEGQGLASEVFIYGRQKKRIDARKMYDLRCFEDPVTQRWQSAVFTTSLKYENNHRTIRRNCNRGTSENVMSQFYKNMPDLGCDAPIHPLPFSVSPHNESDYGGVAQLSSQRTINVEAAVNRLACYYLNEEGVASTTDIVLTAMVYMFQIFYFAHGHVARAFSFNGAPAQTPST